MVTSCASVSEQIHSSSSSSNCFEVRPFSFFKNISCIEQEAALFQQVACSPLDRENFETPEQTSPLTSSCEGDDGVQVFLPFASWTRSTHWRQFDVEQRGYTCFASTLLPHRAPRQFVSPSTPGDSGRLDAVPETPLDEGCSPVPAAVCRTLRGAADQSLHGFADGSSGCRGTSSLPALLSVCGCTLLAVLRSGPEFW